MDVNTRIKVGSLLSGIRMYQKEIEELKEDLNYDLTEVNKILTENGEKPVTIDEIMEEDDTNIIKYRSRRVGF